jgi:hypothetical protein
MGWIIREACGVVAMNCEHCGVVFEVGPSSAGRFCRPECWGLFQRESIVDELLIPHVEAGTPMIKIAADLKVTRGFVRDVMVRQGLYRNWTERRYKKCSVAA